LRFAGVSRRVLAVCQWPTPGCALYAPAIDCRERHMHVRKLCFSKGPWCVLVLSHLLRQFVFSGKVMLFSLPACLRALGVFVPEK